MNIISILIIMFISIQTTYAQNTITYELTAFNSIEVSGRINLELIPSESNEMIIRAKNGNPEDVSMEITDGVLKIKIRTNLEKEASVIIDLPYEEIHSIEVSNGALVNSARNLEGKYLNLKANNGGKIELSVDVKDISAKVNKMSDIILYGKTNSQNVTANTGGNYSAYDMKCKESYVKATSGSQVKVIASKSMDVTSSSKSFVGIIGNPSTRYTKTTMSGKIATFNTPEDAGLGDL